MSARIAAHRRHRAGHALRTLAVLLTLLPAASPLRAGNLLRIESAAGAAGQTGVEIIVTATNDVPIHGYSLAMRYPPDALRVRRVELEGTDIAALHPEFFAERIDPELGVVSFAVILRYATPGSATALPALTSSDPPRIVARITVDVAPDAPGGPLDLRLVDGVGSPPAYNRFTAAGESVEPKLESGTFRVDGANVLELDRVRAFPGVQSTVTIFATAYHDEPLAGYSVAFNYDCAMLELRDAGLSQTSVAAVLGNAGLIDFFQTDVDSTVGGGSCRSRTAVIFEYPKPFELLECPVPVLRPAPGGGGNTIMRYRFDVRPEASADTSWQGLEMIDMGSTSLNSAFLADRCPNAAESVTPRAIHGKIYFDVGGLGGRVVDIRTGSPVAGASVRLDPEGYETTTGNDGLFRLSELIPGRYRVSVEHPRHYMAHFDDVVVSASTAADDAGDLAIYAVPPPPDPGEGVPFRRGDANADSSVDLSDGVFTLNYLFIGGRAPSCFDSIDVDDNGEATISDAITIFNFLFLGRGEPPAPGPLACGPDETPDGLDCLFHPSCTP